MILIKLAKEALNSSSSIKWFKRNFLPLLLFVATFLVIFGHSVTAPIRGQIAFGTNFLSDDGTFYARTMLELVGKSNNESCLTVEKKFNELAKLIEKPNYVLCDSPNINHNALYGPRLIYPYLAAIIYPAVNINSILWIPILIFSLIVIFQYRLAKYLNLSPQAIFFGIIIALTSKYFVQLSLSTAATDLISAALVLFLFSILVRKFSNTKLIFWVVLLILVSTFNKQNQFFWIFFSLTLMILIKIFHFPNKNKLYLSSVVILILQIPSIYFVEYKWNSFSWAEQSKLFPVANEYDNLVLEYIKIAIKILISDSATILTKSLSTLFLFITPILLLIFSYLNRINLKDSISNIRFSIIFCGAVFAGCFANSMIQGFGHTNLRMYLPYITVTVIPTMQLFNMYILKLRK